MWPDALVGAQCLPHVDLLEPGDPGWDGALNPKGLAFYDRLIDALLEAGIESFVTLCHYDIPQVLEDRGGWIKREMTDWFADYAAAMVKHFGDRVTKWMTINEPICISDDHYGGTVEPPGLNDPQARSTVTHHLLLGHGKALGAIKAAGGSHHRWDWCAAISPPIRPQQRKWIGFTRLSNARVSIRG